MALIIRNFVVVNAKQLFMLASILVKREYFAENEPEEFLTENSLTRVLL